MNAPTTSLGRKRLLTKLAAEAPDLLAKARRAYRLPGPQKSPEEQRAYNRLAQRRSRARRRNHSLTTAI